MVSKRWLWLFWIQLLVGVWCLPPVHASPVPGSPPPAPVPAPQKDTAAVTPEVLQRKIAELDQKIKAAQDAENEQTARQLGVDLDLLKKKTALLKELRVDCDWWQVTLERVAAQKKEKTALMEKVAALKEQGVKEPPPYSLTFYEDLLSRLQVLQRQQESIALTSAMSYEGLLAIEQDIADAGKKLRLLQDKLAAATPPENIGKLRFEVELASLEREMAENQFLASQTYGDSLKLRQEMVDPQVEVYRQQIAWVRQHLSIQDSDLAQHLAILGQKKDEVEAKRAAIQRVMEKKAKIWDGAEKAAEAAAASSLVQAEASQERRTRRDAYRDILDGISMRLNILEYEEAIWQKRIALLKGEATQKQLLKWQEGLKDLKDFEGKFYKFLGTENVFLQAQLAAFDNRLAEPSLDPRIRNLLTSQREVYLAMIQEKDALVHSSVNATQLVLRFADEIAGKLAQDPWSTFKARLSETFTRIMDFEIWVIDKQAVTVSKFFDALAFLIAGFLLAKIVLHYLIFPLLDRTVWRHIKAEILQKAVTYLAYTVVFLITLAKLRIPLQSFATLGGGIAIGLGFAAQSVIKNFVSGFILLGDKPFDLGDFVEVGGIMGNIHDIGSRSTLLRTGENTDILVPNSYFLENTITNWTRKDHRIRAQVTVGVAYGSPADQVKELLLQAVTECDRILTTPQPFVLFNDFGDNTLIFDAYFWIEVAGVTERKIIQSALRFRIDEVFRAAGVVFAFPQRDVHIDTQGPIEVRLLEKEPNA